jgi:hypothetical protein
MRVLLLPCNHLGYLTFLILHWNVPQKHLIQKQTVKNIFIGRSLSKYAFIVCAVLEMALVFDVSGDKNSEASK